MRKETDKSIFMPIAICALILSLLLILATDGSRLFSNTSAAVAEAHILLEGLDAATAQALASETSFSLDGGAPCTAVHIDDAEPQPVRITTNDGRILALPSQRLFCTALTLRVTGSATEDGFLADGSHRLLVGSRMQIHGKRIAAEGILLSVTVEPATQAPKKVSLFPFSLPRKWIR